MKNGIVINGVKHKLVESNNPNDCENCSLSINCDRISEALCINLFDEGNSHFEIEK